MGNNGARHPKGEIKRVHFTVFLHKALITVLPEVGVKPVEMMIEVARSSQRDNAVWFIQALDKGELEGEPLPTQKSQAATYGYDPAAFLLGAMVALHKEGIDPAEVRGWGNYYLAGAPQRALEALEEWKVRFA